MDKKTLYEILDIENPGEFEYFENLASLLEYDDYIDEDVFLELISDVDKNVLAGLINNYFEEMTDFLPNDQVELFTLLDNIKMALMGMARNCKEETTVINLSDELNRFRNWYSVETNVHYCDFSGENEIDSSLRDAITVARLEKLDGDKFQYDFSDCLEYPIDDYIMSFADLINAAEEDEDSQSEENALNGFMGM